MALLISILKTTISLKRSTPEWLKDGDDEVDRFDIDGDKEIARKLENLKSKKLSKS